MVDRLGLGPEERKLKLGSSFTNPKECAFHTLRYDFKPASVDRNKMATIDVGTNSQITVTFPPDLIFKGSSKSYQKQGICIINPETGEVTLEKLTQNISVKKTRSENKAMSAKKLSMIDQYISGQKPKKLTSNKGTKSSVSNMSSGGGGGGGSSGGSSSNLSSSHNNKSNSLKHGTKNRMESQSNMNNLLASHSVSAKNSPNSLARFSTGLSPSNASPSKVTLDEQPALDDWFSSIEPSRSNPVKQDLKKMSLKDEVKLPSRMNDEVGELSDSSSSSSCSGDSSDSSSDSETQSQPKKKGCSVGGLNKGSPHPQDLLKEDLQLSESGSDSD